MSEASWEQIENQLAGLRPAGAPPDLRAAVLAEARCELRAGRWDRRLARIAAAMLIVGVGMNAAIGLKAAREERRRVLVSETAVRESLVDAAVVVAEATDAQTGSRYVRQLAAMSGRTLTADEAAAIDAAVEAARPNGNRG